MFSIAQFGTIWHSAFMLSYNLNSKLYSDIKELSNKIALKAERLKEISQHELEEIHRMARVSQVGASTRIENAVLTDPEVNWIDTILSESARPTAFKEEERRIEDKLSKDKERSIEEVGGCREMLLRIYSQAKDFVPLTQSYIRGFHQELLQFYPPAYHYLGNYKTAPNSVIERDAKTGKQRTIFKTADAGPVTEVAMNELVDWYKENIQENPWTLAVASEFVFRFLAIHPFQDGNGRISRGLFLLSLLQSDDKPLAQIAPYIAIDRQIERYRREYYSVLQRCSGGIFHQDPKEYHIEYFLNYMIKIMLLALKDLEIYRERYENIQGLSEAGAKVFDCFKEYPERRLQTKDIIKYIGLPRRTVINSINLLLKSSLIQKRGRGRATRYQVIF